MARVERARAALAPERRAVGAPAAGVPTQDDQLVGEHPLEARLACHRALARAGAPRHQPGAVVDEARRGVDHEAVEPVERRVQRELHRRPERAGRAVRPDMGHVAGEREAQVVAGIHEGRPGRRRRGLRGAQGEGGFGGRGIEKRAELADGQRPVEDEPDAGDVDGGHGQAGGAQERRQQPNGGGPALSSAQPEHDSAWRSNTCWVRKPGFE